MSKSKVKDAALVDFLIKVHKYLDEHRQGMIMNADFPRLLEIYRESRPLYEQVAGQTDEYRPSIVVDVSTGESVLLIGGSEIDHDCTLLNGSE